MTSKFEKLLDYLINEETEKANALFHEIVVEKSRTIYENLVADEMEMESMHVEDDMYDSMSHDEADESVYELAGDEDELGDAEGDPADDLVSDVVDHDAMDMGMDDMDDIDEPASKDEVRDIKDALEELKAEFEALLSKQDDEDMGDMEDDEDMGDIEDDEEEMEDDEEEEDMEEAFIREYREIVKKDPLKGESEKSGVNTHSPVNANPKNRPSGGNVSAGNIAQSGEEGKVTVAKPKGEFVSKGTMNVGGTETKGYKHPTKKPSGEGGVNAKSVVPK